MKQSKNRTFYFVPGRRPQCRWRRDALERPWLKKSWMDFFSILLDSLAEGATVTELVITPWLFFDPEGDEARGTKVKANTNAKPRREQRLFCVACRAWITHQDERIPVQGAHEHDCTNPHGLSFRIGCFRSAPGCSYHGAATLEHSWFKGYAWRIVLCAKCQTHLGWAFEADGGGFYGLILNRLTSRAGTQR